MQCNYTPMRIARHHISWVKSLLSEAVYWRLHLGLGIGGSALLLRQFIPTGNKTFSFSFSKYFPHFSSPLQKNSSSNISPIWSSFCVCVWSLFTYPCQLSPLWFWPLYPLFRSTLPPTFDTFAPCKITTFPFFHYIKNHNFVSLS